MKLHNEIDDYWFNVYDSNTELGRRLLDLKYRNKEINNEAATGNTAENRQSEET